MLPYLILLFTLLPMAELALLIKVGSNIGVVNTIAIVVLTGVAGATLARYQGWVTISKIQQSLAQGFMPTEELLDGMLILVGGITLLTPGFITDTLGLLALLPPTRAVFKTWLKNSFQGRVQRTRTSQQNQVIYTEWEDSDT
ncbi:MAG: FxsA family protein [Candidatus Omnitrophica bacterium]|nr:FxsA family protein [Candidatus Omnitrophota bacterium]